jgi:serine/threonine-protein kinase
LAYELLGERKLALEMIAKAVKLGYPVKNIETEPDLVNLRRDPAYLK